MMIPIDMHVFCMRWNYQSAVQRAWKRLLSDVQWQVLRLHRATCLDFQTARPSNWVKAWWKHGESQWKITKHSHALPKTSGFSMNFENRIPPRILQGCLKIHGSFPDFSGRTLSLCEFQMFSDVSVFLVKWNFRAHRDGSKTYIDTTSVEHAHPCTSFVSYFGLKTILGWTIPLPHWTSPFFSNTSRSGLKEL